MSVLDPASYGDPARYRAQCDMLASAWHVVGDRFELDGASAVPCALALSPLLLARDGDRVRALSNVCTHRGSILLDAPCRGRTIRCPYHGRRFRLDGSVETAPGFDRVDQAERLPELALDALGPLFFAANAPRIEFSALMSRWSERFAFFDLAALTPDRASTRTYEMDAHWLLWCENYLEGFHIPHVHARLARALDLDRYEVHTFEHAALQVGEAADGEACFELPPGHPDFGRQIGGYYVFVYPTTAMNFYPWGLSLNVIRPLGPRRTRIEYRAYVLREDLRTHGAGSDLDRVEREDDAIVERVQHGVASPLYRPGRLHPSREAAIAWLHARLTRDLCHDEAR
jgi:choline monooxygenase